VKRNNLSVSSDRVTGEWHDHIVLGEWKINQAHDQPCTYLFGADFLADLDGGEHMLAAGEVDVVTRWLHGHTDEVQLKTQSCTLCELQS